MIQRLLLAFFLLVAPASGQGTEQPTRILFVGNSYTYYNDLPHMVQLLAASLGEDLEVDSVVAGGATLAGHLEQGEVAERLREQRYDWVLLQGQSMLGTRFIKDGRALSEVDTSGYEAAAGALIALVRKFEAKPAMMLTWARRDFPETQELLDEAILGVVQEQGVGLVPAGMAWSSARREAPDLELYAPDGSHPAPAGTYLVACSVLHHLLGLEIKELPARVSFSQEPGDKPQELVNLEPVDASLIRSLVQGLAVDLPPLEQAKPKEAAAPRSIVSAEDVGAMARVLGEPYTEKELKGMVSNLTRNLQSYTRLRALPLENAVQPALHFLPDGLQRSPGELERLGAEALAMDSVAVPERPEDLEQLAYASIRELHALLRAGKVSCVELTEMYLARLARLDEQLECVINFTDERALAQARALDRELKEGKLRGPLHGIPWVAKDLLAVRGTPTTWGAKPFEDQLLDYDATVVERLDQAGAILIAKVSLGALAMGDVWFGGVTRNPWNLKQGSSGSSAGPSAATAAGCAGFSIGSETLGSIVSPSARCGNSSLRPSFGRVPRGGAMTLSWSMDKLGPICRSAEDAALVFDAIHGAHGDDPSAVSLGFDALLDASDVRGWKVGFLEQAFEDSEESQSVLEELEALGVELIPIELPAYPLASMSFVLSAEAAAAFDEFSRGADDEELVSQEPWSWPTTFRAARLISAVDYLRANRLRTQNIKEFTQAIAGLDALVHPSFASRMLLNTNLTGHPTFVAPAGFRPDGTPHSISFTGQLHGETRLMALARAWQASTPYHKQHPDL